MYQNSVVIAHNVCRGVYVGGMGVVCDSVVFVGGYVCGCVCLVCVVCESVCLCGVCRLFVCLVYMYVFVSIYMCAVCVVCVDVCSV